MAGPLAGARAHSGAHPAEPRRARVRAAGEKQRETRVREAPTADCAGFIVRLRYRNIERFSL